MGMSAGAAVNQLALALMGELFELIQQHEGNRFTGNNQHLQAHKWSHSGPILLLIKASGPPVPLCLPQDTTDHFRNQCESNWFVGKMFLLWSFLQHTPHSD